MSENNQDEDHKYIARLYLGRKSCVREHEHNDVCKTYNGELWADVNIYPRDQQEAIAVLNMLADSTRGTLDKLNKLARINYEYKTVKS